MFNFSIDIEFWKSGKNFFAYHYKIKLSKQFKYNIDYKYQGQNK